MEKRYLTHHQGQPMRQGYRLCDAANDQIILEVRCTACRRLGYYLAIDLIKIYPEKAAQSYKRPLFPCRSCKSADYIRVDLRYPKDGDFGSLTIRRPGPVKHIQTWVDVKLGDVA